MRANRHYIAQAALALMPLLAIPTADGTLQCRITWEIAAVWGAVVAVSFWLRSWWWRIFLWLALFQVFRHPDAAAYMSLAMIVIFLGAAQIFSEVKPGRLMDLMAISALGLVALMGFQQAGIVPFYNKYGLPAGFFNPNAAGVYLGIWRVWSGRASRN